jgi:hypothetical protein
MEWHVKYSIAVGICAFIVVAAGCAANMGNEIRSGNAKLLPETVNVTPFGTNYRINGVVEAGQQRNTMFVYATDCEKGYGVLGSDDHPIVYIENVLASGAKPADKLFSQMCRLGRATAARMESQLTDQQRAARLRGAQQALATSYAIEAAQKTQQNHDDAIRDAGKQVSDAIKQQGNKSVTCTATGAGYVCN